MGISAIFASSTFLFVYSGLLVVLTAVAIVRNQISINSEAQAARDIVRIVEAANTRDAAGKVAQLVLLNETTGARILTHDACRADDLGEHKVWRNPTSAAARATAAYLGVMAAVPAERHSLEGLRPSRTMLEDEYRRLHRGLSGFGDFIIRVALLGTFMGLIAALNIASTNIGAGQGLPPDVQSVHMRDFIQVLLATAANKFWISAVGIGCALVVQIYRNVSERAPHIVRLGDAFDHALTDPEIAAAWCPPSDDAAIDARLMSRAVRERISKLDMGPLSEAITETAAAIKANARDSVISFGPAPSRRSAE